MLDAKELKEKYSERYQELERQLKEKDSILDNYKKEHGKLEIFFDKIISSLSPVSPLPSIYTKSPNSIKGGSPITAVMQISDSHMGSVQLADEIEGFNEYNPEICEQRSMEYVKRFIDWVEMHRGRYVINECAILVTGDLIAGDIHDELRVTNAFPAPVQVVRAAELLTKQISTLAPHFHHITVHFLVEDNHARLTKKPQMKEAGYNSLNYIVGKMTELYLQKVPNIEFNLYPMFEKVVTVNILQYLLCHGHKMMAWSGLPFYSIERKVGKESMARLQLIMNDLTLAKQIGFHRYIGGHWHIPFASPLYAFCGSVQGTDAYDHAAGRYADPSQSSWMVGKRGEFDRINFTLK